MANGLSIGHTRAAADAALSRFRTLFAITLAVQALTAALALFAPAIGAAFTGVAPGPIAPAMELWGAMVLVATALQLPGWIRPVEMRFLVGIAILARLFMAVVFWRLGPEFLRLALFDGILGVALAILFHRALIAELQTRP